MKVFTNTNFATGKASAGIKANRIVGISAVDGDIIQAVAATVPIGVSHNFDTDAGQPVTVIPIGAGFARVEAGMTLGLADLGAAVGADADGCVTTSYTKQVGILAGLSADVDGAVSNAAKGDDVVVLLTGITANSPAKGTLKFVAKDTGVAEAGVEVTITIGDDTLTGVTNDKGEKIFLLEAGDYGWAAEKASHTIDPALGTATVTAGQTTTVALSVTNA